MVSNLPSGLIFHDNWKAFNRWHEEHVVIDFFIGILGIFVTIVFSFIPSLKTFIVEHLFATLFILGVFIILILYKFFKWKFYNFKRTSIFVDSLLIINYDDELLTIDVADNIIIPSEDILRLNLTLNFDEDIIKDLEKSEKYEIIFDKPTNLEINYIEKEHVNAEVVGNDKYSKEFKIQFDFRNNAGDTHVFELESDLDTTGNLKIYFRNRSYDNISKRGLFKDNPLFDKEISTTEVKLL